MYGEQHLLHKSDENESSQTSAQYYCIHASYHMDSGFKQDPIDTETYLSPCAEKESRIRLCLKENEPTRNSLNASSDILVISCWLILTMAEPC